MPGASGGLRQEVFRDGPMADRLLAAWCHTLKHAGGRQLIRVLERLDRKKMAAEVRAGA